MRIMIFLSRCHQLVAPASIEGSTLLVGLVIQSEHVEKVREMKGLVFVKSSAHSGRESRRISARLENLENGLAFKDISLAEKAINSRTRLLGGCALDQALNFANRSGTFVRARVEKLALVYPVA